MPSDALPSIDVGLLAPVSVGHDALLSDGAVLSTMIRVECALVAAYVEVGAAPREARVEIDHVFGIDEKYGSPERGIDVDRLVREGVAGGNPVIPLVGMLKAQVPEEHRAWIHRGATSQDILDTALMVVARRAVEQTRRSTANAAVWARQLAERHADDVAAARTLTQHAVPTTIGARAATWARGLERAAQRLGELTFPAQLAGAGGTLASFVEITGSRMPRTPCPRLSPAFWARRPRGPWHTSRWPVTEIGDALVQAIDALGKVAADVATLGRTEIGEVSEGVGGGSSAMPQKQNPAEAVLIRSAALRAPHLAATLHVASALAVDERPDGAWHAEWPTLRELLRLAVGAAAHGSSLLAHLRVDVDAAASNAGRTGGRIVSERLRGVLVPLIGAERFAALLAGDDDLAPRLRAIPELQGTGIDIAALVDPAAYLGLAPRLARGTHHPGGGTAREHLGGTA